MLIRAWQIRFCSVQKLKRVFIHEDYYYIVFISSYRITYVVDIYDSGTL